MGRAMDVYNEVELKTLYHDRRATQGGETVYGTVARDEIFDTLGFEGVAVAYATIQFDASAASADTVQVVIQKCTDTAGTGATALTTFTAVAGDGAAKTYRIPMAVNLYSLGDSSGTPYRYLRAAITIVDANSSGTFDVCVVLAAGSKKKKPVTLTADES